MRRGALVDRTRHQKASSRDGSPHARTSPASGAGPAVSDRAYVSSRPLRLHDQGLHAAAGDHHLTSRPSGPPPTARLTSSAAYRISPESSPFSGASKKTPASTGSNHRGRPHGTSPGPRGRRRRTKTPELISVKLRRMIAVASRRSGRVTQSSHSRDRGPACNPWSHWGSMPRWQLCAGELEVTK